MKQINTPFSLLSLPKASAREGARERTGDRALLSKNLAAPDGEIIDFRENGLISLRK